MQNYLYSRKKTVVDCHASSLCPFILTEMDKTIMSCEFIAVRIWGTQIIT